MPFDQTSYDLVPTTDDAAQARLVALHDLASHPPGWFTFQFTPALSECRTYGCLLGLWRVTTGRPVYVLSGWTKSEFGITEEQADYIFFNCGTPDGQALTLAHLADRVGELLHKRSE